MRVQAGFLVLFPWFFHTFVMVGGGWISTSVARPRFPIEAGRQNGHPLKASFWLPFSIPLRLCVVWYWQCHMGGDLGRFWGLPRLRQAQPNSQAGRPGTYLRGVLPPVGAKREAFRRPGDLGLGKHTPYAYVEGLLRQAP